MLTRWGVGAFSPSWGVPPSLVFVDFYGVPDGVLSSGVVDDQDPVCSWLFGDEGDRHVAGAAGEMEAAGELCCGAPPLVGCGCADGEVDVVLGLEFDVYALALFQSQFVSGGASVGEFARVLEQWPRRAGAARWRFLAGSGLRVCRECLLLCPALQDCVSDGIIVAVADVDVAVDGEQAGDGSVVDAEEHDLLASVLDEIPNCAPLEAAPFLGFVVLAEEDDVELSIVVVQVLEVHVEVWARKFCLMKTVVEDAIAAQTCCEVLRNRFDAFSCFAGKREGDGEPPDCLSALRRLLVLRGHGPIVVGVCTARLFRRMGNGFWRRPSLIAGRTASLRTSYFICSKC